MLGPAYLDFIRYFYCTCLTRPPDFLSRFRNLAGATQRLKIDKIESQVAPAEEAAFAVSPTIARLRNHDATDDDNVGFRSFQNNRHSKLVKLM